MWLALNVFYIITFKSYSWLSLAVEMDASMERFVAWISAWRDCRRGGDLPGCGRPRVGPCHVVEQAADGKHDAAADRQIEPHARRGEPGNREEATRPDDDDGDPDDAGRDRAVPAETRRQHDQRGDGSKHQREGASGVEAPDDDRRPHGADVDGRSHPRHDRTDAGEDGPDEGDDRRSGEVGLDVHSGRSHNATIALAVDPLESLASVAENASLFALGATPGGMRVREGAVEIEAPEQAEAGVGEDVFYNPVQELNRDVTVAVLRACADREPRAESYCDATAATGIRGVRAAAEGWQVTCCDTDPDAAALCEDNLARNGLEGRVLERDANAVLHEDYFDVVDVDPFGSPVPFADAAIQGTRDLLCVTATDTAPLCGAHFESGVRRYSTVPRNTEYHAEMGVRVLLSALVRTAARYDVAATPILTHATKHYVRTYLELEGSASAANAAIDALGHIYHCEHCLRRETERDLVADPPAECPNCGHGIQTAGPMWLGPTHDAGFVAAVREGVSEEMGTAERARDLLATLEGELAVPTHYDQHRLCKRWGRPATAMAEFLDSLRAAGYDASRTHYGGTTFKTPASVSEIEAATGE